MRSIVRWSPFTELDRMRHVMDRFFGDFRPFYLTPEESDAGFVPIDVAETDEAFEVEAALPGVRPEQIEVLAHDDTVTIKGETTEESEEKGKSWLRRERRYGAFARSFTLPTAIDIEKASADFEDGVLKLRLPKSEAVRPKTIKVGSKGALPGQES